MYIKKRKFYRAVSIEFKLSVNRNMIVVFLFLFLFVAWLCRTPQRESRTRIPRVIHKIYIQHDNTFGTIQSEIQNAHDSWSRLNPEYKIKYYNGKDCEEYLMRYFGRKHLQTYQNINAYSGKVNFMRACIVYNEGGWYSDWKQVCLKPLDGLCKHDWVSAHDQPFLHKKYKRSFMMNAFFGAVSKHPLAKRYIDNIIRNVETKFYGDSPLDTTGTGCLGKSFDEMKNNTNNMLIGKFDGSCFTFLGVKWVQHKCDKCKKGQNWKHGNNYNDLWNNRTYYR